MVPDHWLPIVLMARQRKWSTRETAIAALQAGTGHVVSTLLIAVLFWGAGAAVATRFSGWIETATSLALVGFGLWVAVGAWREMAHEHGHQHGHHHHDHSHGHSHSHDAKTGSRMTLLLILGSSPMIEGIPAFFAASRFGAALIVLMAVVFAVSTIATYVTLCVVSSEGLRRVSLGPFERYGEVMSGVFIVLVGAAFWVWPLA